MRFLVKVYYTAMCFTVAAVFALFVTPAMLTLADEPPPTDDVPESDGAFAKVFESGHEFCIVSFQDELDWSENIIIRDYDPGDVGVEVTLPDPIIQAVYPEHGKVISDISGHLPLNDIKFLISAPAGGEIRPGSVAVKVMDEEGNRIQGYMTFSYPQPSPISIIGVSFTPYESWYELPNGIYTVEVEGEDMEMRSVRKTWQFAKISRMFLYTRLTNIRYEHYIGNRMSEAPEAVRNENWENYVSDAGHVSTPTVYYQLLVGQFGYSSVRFDEKEAIYICSFSNEGGRVFGTYSLSALEKRYYRKAKLTISPRATLLSRLYTNSQFNPFILEVYIDGARAGVKEIQRDDVFCSNCTIDIDLDIDAVRAGQGVQLELVSNRFKKENPVGCGLGYQEYLEAIEITSGATIQLYDPKIDIKIEAQPEEGSHSGSFATDGYWFSAPRILSYLSVASSLASRGDYSNFSRSKIIITPYIATQPFELGTTVSWHAVGSYVITEPTEGPYHSINLPANTCAYGVRYEVTLVTDEIYRQRHLRNVGLRSVSLFFTPYDILVGVGTKIVPGYWSHIGMYMRDGHGTKGSMGWDIHYGRVVESHIAHGGVAITQALDWPRKYKTWAALRVVTADDQIRDNAIMFALRKRGAPYDLNWLLKQVDGSSWYCSELVWAAYLVASNGSINLEHGPDIFGVTIDEIVNDEETELIYRHDEEVSHGTGFVVTAKCPVDLRVVDPDNFSVSKQSFGIPGAIYGEDDIDEDGSPEDWIGISERKNGKYLISVMPDSNALPNDTYALEVTTDDVAIVLANNVPVSQIPSAPYTVLSTEEGIVPVIINNPPVADAGASYVGYEGSPVTFDASGSADPDGDTLQYRWDFDNNGVYDTEWSPSPVATYTWPDDWNGYVTVEVSDGVLTDIDRATITVNNVPPTVGTIGAPLDPMQAYQTVNASAMFTDPGTDGHTAVWNWGDNSSQDTVVLDVGSRIANGSHIYTTPGVYTITLTIIDDDGGSDEITYQYVMVYNPDGGFVTGGGWINSPIGAYAGDPTLTGKANFGFVSKYTKGATVPTGNTEFNLKVADLNFHSTEYEWLVVSGARAQYKGTGTVNGTGNYGFILTAIDGQISGVGGVDKFRIKIWDKASDTVIYDTQMGDADDAEPATAIGGGSIVIHKGAKASPKQKPDATCLLAYYPSPANPDVWIPYQLSIESEVTIRIYDISGRLVRTLELGYRSAGFYTAKDRAAYWDGRNEAGELVASGVYFYTIQAGDFTATRKMVIQK